MYAKRNYSQYSDQYNSFADVNAQQLSVKFYRKLIRILIICTSCVYVIGFRLDRETNTDATRDPKKVVIFIFPRYTSSFQVL